MDIYNSYHGMDNYTPIISIYWSNRAQHEKPDRKIANGTQTGCSDTFKEKEEKEIVIVFLKNLLVIETFWIRACNLCSSLNPYMKKVLNLKKKIKKMLK